MRKLQCHNGRWIPILPSSRSCGTDTAVGLWHQDWLLTVITARSTLVILAATFRTESLANACKWLMDERF